MKLIQISDRTLINPNSVDSIEVRTTKSQGTIITVTVNGKPYQATRVLNELIAEIDKHGTDRFKQFTAV